MMKWLWMLAWMFGCFAVGGLGAWLGGTMGAADPWYHDIAKPFWTPPDKIFGPVWTMLYLMMGIAVWHVMERRSEEKYASIVTFAEMEANGFNLNIPRYVDTYEPEPEIDMAALQRDIERLEGELIETRGRMSTYLAELGIDG